MSDNRSRSMPCPFCKDGEYLPYPKGSMFSWQRTQGRGVKRHHLEAMRCNNCGVIVFKARQEVKNVEENEQSP